MHLIYFPGNSSVFDFKLSHIRVGPLKTKTDRDDIVLAIYPEENVQEIICHVLCDRYLNGESVFDGNR